ncbi:hypothetical protein [Cellulomonas fimi]|uniref:Uncharacterized protein n=1 Tax=Cellulomonas fimi TaxID=1708 RepID=A0A7Y0LWN2_CELFI|nr:hypothetical protein [Cellulomonas fimi]NMR19420.1 hypothetical protein [Cellulomonas fimi]
MSTSPSGRRTGVRFGAARQATDERALSAVPPWLVVVPGLLVAGSESLLAGRGSMVR